MSDQKQLKAFDSTHFWWKLCTWPTRTGAGDSVVDDLTNQ